MKTILTTSLITFIAVAFFEKCPLSPFVANSEPQGEQVAFVDDSPVIEPTSPSVDDIAAAHEALADKIVADIMARISSCLNEHLLVATFQDGSTDYMPIPTFAELEANLNGDFSIFEREVKSAVLHALEMGAVQFEIIDIEPESKGSRA